AGVADPERPLDVHDVSELVCLIARRRGKTVVETEDDVGRHHHESRRAGILVWHHEFSTNERVASARWFDCLDANRQSARTKKLVIVGWERKTAEPEFVLPSASALPPRAKVAIS